MSERDRMAEVEDLQAMAAEDLRPELVPWVEEGPFGPMLRHPLVYSVPVMLPGMANRAYAAKRKSLDNAIDEEDWHTVVFLHERPYRLRALIQYCVGREEMEGGPLPLRCVPEHWALAADVWVDSENIEQEETAWRELLDPDNSPDLWLGTDEERAEFDALPDPVPAWRGGIVGDWSWTTDINVAEFFSRRSGYPPRFAMIPKDDCFGYLTRRGEAELLVRLTPEREPLVYPNRFDGSE